MTPIPPAFFINLSSRPDRLAHMQAQFDRVGMSAERIDALTPEGIPEVTRSRQAKLPPERRLSPNEVACSLSHRKAWQTMLDRGHSCALFMEDDAYISDQLPKVLSDPNLLKPNVDAIQFETHRTSALLGRRVSTTADGVYKHRLMSSSLGGAAYLLTADFAKRLLAAPEIDDVCQDSLIFSRNGGYIYSDRIYQVSPALAFQIGKMGDASHSVGKSDLSEGRNGRRKRGRRRTFLGRLSKLRDSLKHIGRIFLTFGKTGELLTARQVRLAVAPDILPMMDANNTKWRRQRRHFAPNRG
ncbi:glycosyltransferase family 25 protein [Devosia sp.]|uniref:glycosyltransferase family 25 protein n=1 Tax=Devosia sp. TaxID=1871048 RepID=UPI003A9572A1